MKYRRFIALAALLLILAACGEKPQAPEPERTVLESQTAAQADDELLAALAAMQNASTTGVRQGATMPEPVYYNYVPPAIVPGMTEAPTAAVTAQAQTTTTRKGWTYNFSPVGNAATTTTAATAASTAAGAATTSTTVTTTTFRNANVFAPPTPQTTAPPAIPAWSISVIINGKTQTYRSTDVKTQVTYPVTTIDSIDRQESRLFVGVRVKDVLEHLGVNLNTLSSGKLVAVAEDNKSAEYSINTIKHSNTILAWEEKNEAIKYEKPRMCPGDTTNTGMYLKNVVTIELKSQ